MRHGRDLVAAAPPIDPEPPSSPTRTTSGHRPRRGSRGLAVLAPHRRRAAGRHRRSSPTATSRCCERTLRDLVAAHQADGAAVTVLTARVADPTGYGRVLRDAAGDVLARSSSTRTPRRPSARSTRSTAGSTRSTARSWPRRWPRITHRQRPGRAVPHRRRRASRARTADASGRVPADDVLADRGRQRPGPARRRSAPSSTGGS